jgi:hypothetical protein
MQLRKPEAYSMLVGSRIKLARFSPATASRELSVNRRTPLQRTGGVAKIAAMAQTVVIPIMASFIQTFASSQDVYLFEELFS